ncbi:hypothetical protein [Methyloligella solikamskensis]|uniref:Tetratricopeptide repeat protein n=1 Tax=Methyloligella solikamskensis TaxID=1177756 RepID=A0ABW3JC39_9HYPH
MSMSGAPISERKAERMPSLSESWSTQEMINAGWREADLQWEEASAAVLDALSRDNYATAAEHAGRALQLARENFEPIDPRLGTSLANYGICLAIEGDAAALQSLVDKALNTWRGSQPWIAKLTAPRSARSSMFHLRMEALHRETYRARWRQRWQEIAEESTGRLQRLNDRLASGDPASPQVPAETMLATWMRERPAMLNDTRKLLGASLLLLVS